MKTIGPRETAPQSDHGERRLRDDLQKSLRAFPHECVIHLRQNLDRLAPRAWTSPGNKGCVFYLLSERLPERIQSVRDLAQHFPREIEEVGMSGMTAWLVLRAFDGYGHHDAVDDTAFERYEGTVLDRDLLRQELDALIREESGAGEGGSAPDRRHPWDLSLAMG